MERGKGLCFCRATGVKCICGGWRDVTRGSGNPCMGRVFESTALRIKAQQKYKPPVGKKTCKSGINPGRHILYALRRAQPMIYTRMEGKKLIVVIQRCNEFGDHEHLKRDGDILLEVCGGEHASIDQEDAKYILEKLPSRLKDSALRRAQLMTQKQQDPLKEAIEEVKAHSAETRRQSRSSVVAANLIMFTVLGMALLTIIGLWVRHFWLGYVFAGIEISGPVVLGIVTIVCVTAALIAAMFARREK